MVSKEICKLYHIKLAGSGTIKHVYTYRQECIKESMELQYIQ